MLAYDHSPSIHPWTGWQLQPDSSDPTTVALDQQQVAYALAALAQSPQQNLGGMDALQLLQGHVTDHGAATAAGVDLTQLLAQLPTPPGLDPLPGIAPAASSPQQYSTTEPWAQTASHHSGASSPTTMSQDSQSPTGPRLFVPESLKAATAAVSTPNPQLLLQAALGQHQPGMVAGVTDVNSLLPLLQEQLLMQALQQQTAALAAGAAAPPGLGQPSLPSPLAALANSTSGNLWPFVPPSLADPAAGAAATAAAATAAALLAAQQQQQQAALTRALASSALLGGADINTLLQQLLLSQQALAPTAAGTSAAGGVLNQLQPWALKALAAQMQQQGGAGTNLAAFSQQQLALASLLNSTTVNSSSSSLPRPAPNGGLGRRSRTGRRSSGTAAAAADLAASFGVASRAGSVAGSDVLDGRPGLPAVLPPGMSVQDLCPSKYEDTWGGSADAEATATTSNVVTDSSCQLARGASSASSSSIESVTEGPGSLCGSALSISSTGRTGSAASCEDKWQWDSHFCSLDEDVAAKGSSGVAGRATRKGAAAQTKAAQGDDTASAKDQGNKKTAPPAAGCPVWIPGGREAAGDDSWYLPRPPTCRLFVGNIGCWVDESMLLAYFGKYGHVVDVQVMWNTKMLARGRRVNREFAFISYSSPLEAARAVHWLDGCRLPDMEKDKNGVTVEYENGEGDIPAAK